MDDLIFKLKVKIQESGKSVEEVFDGIDRNNSGRIQFPEFYS